MVDKIGWTEPLGSGRSGMGSVRRARWRGVCGWLRRRGGWARMIGPEKSMRTTSKRLGLWQKALRGSTGELRTSAASAGSGRRSGRGVLPYALERKYPSAARDWAWQYVFPSDRLSEDPRTDFLGPSWRTVATSTRGSTQRSACRQAHANPVRHSVSFAICRTRPALTRQAFSRKTPLRHRSNGSCPSGGHP
jgi:hypothetical protein